MISGGAPFCNLFSMVFRIVSNKESAIKDCYVWIADKEFWDLRFRTVLGKSESIEFESLMSLLSNVLFCMDTVDAHIWKSDSSRYIIPNPSLGSWILG